MYVKLIRVSLKDSHRESFFEKQNIWNRAMSVQPGFVDSMVATNVDADHEIAIITLWRDKESLDRFMQAPHDNLLSIASAANDYDNLEITHYEIEDAQLRNPSGQLLFNDGPQSIIACSEAYRASIVLRTAVLAGFFEVLGDSVSSVSDLSDLLGIKPDHTKKLCKVLEALGLVFMRESEISATSVAQRYLQLASPLYLGNLVLHNTNPNNIDRWQQLPEQINIDSIKSESGHKLFIEAMRDIAKSGQASELANLVTLMPASQILDIGGAAGDNSFALLRRYPDATANILDLEMSRDIAIQAITNGGFENRCTFTSGDFREQLPEQQYDVVLLSNILRGENESGMEQLLQHSKRALRPGGQLVVVELFSDTSSGYSGILSQLFGLHLPDAANPTTSDITVLLDNLGFNSVTTRFFKNPIVANAVISAS